MTSPNVPGKPFPVGYLKNHISLNRVERTYGMSAPRPWKKKMRIFLGVISFRDELTVGR
jgi:hypothetical protein